jgi:hypothetical protein
MNKYFRHLLAICIASGSLLVSNPSFAQTTSGEVKQENTNIVTTAVTSSTEKSEQTGIKKKSVTADNSDKKLATKNNRKTSLNINSRIPIFSRIFAAPTMQQ